MTKLIRVIEKTEQAERTRQEKEKRKDVKHVRCKHVLYFICGLLWNEGNTSSLSFAGKSVSESIWAAKSRDKHNKTTGK